MRSQNIAILVVKTIFFDTLRDIVRFPIWWYSKGLVRTWDNFILGVRNAELRMGVLIWIKNIGRPMFGQHDIWGRIISFIIRILQIIFRAIILIIWVMLLLLKVVFWVVLPVVIISQIIYQFTGGFFTAL